MNRNRRLVISAVVAGTAGSALGMVLAGLPEGTSVLRYLAVLVIMTTATGLFAGLTRPKDEARNVMFGLVAGQVIGVLLAVLASLLPFEESSGQVLTALAWAGYFLGGMAIVVGLVFGMASLSLGGRFARRVESGERIVEK